MKKNVARIFKILKGLITVFLLLVLIVILVQRFSGNNLSIGGIRIFTIISPSMTPAYQVGDIVISKDVLPSEIKKGDDITYNGKKGDFAGLVITHRVVEEREENGKSYFTTKGLANNSVDPEISEDDIIGKVIYKTFVFSFLGRLMTNIIIYYLLFVVIGVYVSYQIVSSFILNKKGNKDD